MVFERPHSLSELAALANGTVVGKSSRSILGLASVAAARDGDLVFADTEKYVVLAACSKASAVVVSAHIDSGVLVEKGKALIVAANAHVAFDKIAAATFSHLDAPPEVGIHPTAVIASTATVAPGCSIGPFCVVGSGVVIGCGSVLTAHVVIDDRSSLGANCLIGAHTTIHRRCLVGDGVTVGAGCQIGSDAFYAYMVDGTLVKGRALAAVELKSNVEIGAGCTIDRGISANTLIGEDSKLDNQVHVGHDAHIGNRVRIAAQTGIAGHVVIGDDVTLRGQVGIMQSVTIGPRAVVLGKSGITKDVRADETVFGIPATTRERYAQARRLVMKRVRRLEKIAESPSGDNRDAKDRVFRALADVTGNDLSDIKIDQDLVDDLGLDSLDRIAFQMAVEDEFEAGLLRLHLDERALDKVRTVGDVVNLVRETARAK